MHMPTCNKLHHKVASSHLLSLQANLDKLLLILRLVVVLVFLLAASALGSSGSLRVIDSSSEPLSLHPHRAFGPYSDVIISQIYEGLVDYDFKGRLVPRLATRWQELSPTRYRFWLRKGVKFHNGEPFDSNAVKFSVEFMMHVQPMPDKAWLFDPDLRVEIVDQYTVDLVTNLPDARLPSILPMFMMILPPVYYAKVGDDGLERNPNGTGPYRFLERNPGHSIRLTSNREYWQPGLPRISDVTFLFVPQNQQVDVLMRGGADLVTKLKGSDSLPVMTGPNTRVVKRQEVGVLWVSLKNVDSPFADRRVRQAVNYAVNKEHLIEYVDKGNSAITSVPAGAVTHGIRKTFRPYPFDLQRARRLLAESGYQHGFKVRVLASDQAEDMIRAMKSQLKVVGVEMDITIVPGEDILHRIMLSKTKTGINADRWDMVARVITNPTLNDFFIPALLFSSQSPVSILHDPTFDQIYSSFVREKNPALQREKADKLLSRAMNEAYGIFIAQRVKIYGTHWDLSINTHPTGMLIGRTLAEAFWKEQSDSIWNERSLMKKRKGRE